MQKIALWMAKNVLGCHHARVVAWRRGDEAAEVYALGDMLLSPEAWTALVYTHNKEVRVPGGKWDMELVDSAHFLGRDEG